MSRWQARYGSEVIATARTEWGIGRRARRWLRSPVNSVRRARMGNLTIERKS